MASPSPRWSGSGSVGSDENSVAVVEGDRVAVSRRRAADNVLVRSTGDEHAVAAVAPRAHAVDLRADQVALDLVARLCFR